MLKKFYIRSVSVDSDRLELVEDSYLKQVPSIRYLLKGNTLNFSAPVTFLIGENGCGKSTLLEAIAVAYGFNPEGGTKNFNFHTKNSHSDFHKCLRIGRQAYAKDGFFLRAESFYNVASNLDELGGTLLESYGGISLHNQSHGESFLALVQNRFGGNGLYILDEPEAALSPMKLLILLAEIKYLAEQNSQFIISTHSPILMAFPGAQILEVSKDGINEVVYEQTEHYQVTKGFLNNPEGILQELFD